LPIEVYDGSNPTSANPLPLNNAVAIVSGFGETDANGALVSGQLAFTMIQPPFSSNGVVYYFDLSNGNARGFLFTNVVLFTEIEGGFELRPPPPDADDDGIPDAQDNCILAANQAQRDTDNDGFGNVCDADLDNDCQTNVVDLALLRQVYFGTDPDADLNGDGVVNTVDLGIMRARFFQSPGPSAFASCSDPS
jgi:hypothetical protein